MENLKTVFDVLSAGGPYGVASLLFVMWWLERKERQELQKQFFEIATKQISANMKLEASVNALKDLFNQLAGRL